MTMPATSAAFRTVMEQAEKPVKVTVYALFSTRGNNVFDVLKDAETTGKMTGGAFVIHECYVAAERLAEFMALVAKGILPDWAKED